MIEPIEIQNRLLRATRELDRRADGVVVTLRVENRNRKPVKFQLFDPLGDQLAADTVRFHPDDEPIHGRIDTELVVVGGIVEPEKPHVTRYAIEGQALPSTDELHRIQKSARPSIEISDIVGPEYEDEAVEAELERAAMTRSASQQASPDTDRTSVDSSDLAELWAGMDTTAAADPGPTDQTRKDEDYPSLAEVVQGTDEAAPNRALNADDDDDGSTSADAQGDIAERLLEQLEAGEVSEAQRQRLADHLADALGTTPPRQLSSRIDALESELSTVVTYLETLDGIIDEHGPPEAFLGEVRQQVAALAASMDEIEMELDGAAATRSRTEGTLEAVDDTLSRVASRTERLDDRLRSLREAHRTRAAEIESRLEDFEPVVDRVEELEDELESLAEAVEDLEARRLAIWQALTDDEVAEE